jgi:hypothetical protein
MDARQGIEPRKFGSKPNVLPLNDLAIWMPEKDSNLQQSDSESEVLPIELSGNKMVKVARLELAKS